MDNVVFNAAFHDELDKLAAGKLKKGIAAGTLALSSLLPMGKAHAPITPKTKAQVSAQKDANLAERGRRMRGRVDKLTKKMKASTKESGLVRMSLGQNKPAPKPVTPEDKSLDYLARRQRIPWGRNRGHIRMSTNAKFKNEEKLRSLKKKWIAEHEKNTGRKWEDPYPEIKGKK